MEKKIFIYGQYVEEPNIQYLHQLKTDLIEHGFEYRFFSSFLDKARVFEFDDSNPTIEDHEELKEYDPFCCISLGGDGTILNAVTIIRDLGIPILGVNLGNLGFLASTEKTKIQSAISQLAKHKYTITTRTMLSLESTPGIFGDTAFALNDFTLHKRDTSSLVTIHAYLNGEFLNSYWADGLIVATPTGSTGYSLSCGGPIIYPNSDNFIITPIAPHNLNVRPLVIGDDSMLEFTIEGRSKNYLCTLDSRYETVTEEHRIAIRKCPFAANFIQLKNKSFLKTIRQKLHWGTDTRL